MKNNCKNMLMSPARYWHVAFWGALTCGSASDGSWVSFGFWLSFAIAVGASGVWLTFRDDET